MNRREFTGVTDGAGQMATDLPGLRAMLTCGRTTAERIAKAAGAEIKIGGRRLYNVEKVRRYLDTISGDKTAE